MKRFLPLVLAISGALLFAGATQILLAATGQVKQGGDAKMGWQAQWEKILAGARKEGKIVLYGPPIAPTRKAFIEVFQKSYPGITLDYLALGGSQVPPK